MLLYIYTHILYSMYIQREREGEDDDLIDLTSDFVDSFHGGVDRYYPHFFLLHGI